MMNNKHKSQMIQIVLSTAFLVLAVAIPASGMLKAALFLIPYLVSGHRVLLKAGKNIHNGYVFDENLLMCVATLGAFALGEYAEAVMVMLFFQVGNLFEKMAVGRSRKSIANLMDIRPDTATVKRNSSLVQVPPEEVRLNEIIVVAPGERIPLDGVIVEGTATLDMSALTGESRPVYVQTGEKVTSGAINRNGVLHICVEKVFEDSTVSRILDLVEASASRKAKTEKFITKFAGYYTPAVCLAAVGLMIIPSLLFGSWMMWLRRALVFLVVSCPCALVISVPLSFFGGIGGASRQGILIKGGNYLEALGETRTVVFDKTGTLTEGVFRVVKLEPTDITEDELLFFAACGECFSSHPIARSVMDFYGKNVNREKVVSCNEVLGKGVISSYEDKRIVVGNYALMTSMKIPCSDFEQMGTTVHVAVDEKYMGRILISDSIKQDARETVERLRQLGIKKIVMLTGDSDATGEAVGKALGMDEVRCRLLPNEKVSELERLIRETDGKGRVLFVGDGINDAPVLARADIGIAMGALGTDAAIEAADVVLMDDRTTGVATAVEISQRTRRIVRQNIMFALGVKGVVLLLSSFGLAGMWSAVFADVGVSVLAILNAMRAMTNWN